MLVFASVRELSAPQCLAGAPRPLLGQLIAGRALVAAIGSIWLTPSTKLIAPDLGQLQYARDPTLEGVSAYYRPWSLDAPCADNDGGGVSLPTWCDEFGGGRYGLKQTMWPKPTESGLCDQVVVVVVVGGGGDRWW